MFKIESYLAPILLSYVNKYIKNIKPEDLQLSLWGGDLVLNKLDLKLDVLEHDLNLPISFVSGHIHELRIHVPWHKLIYEPVVVTINTIECVLKLRDAADSDRNSTSSKSSSVAKITEKKSKPKKVHHEEDIPPSYVQILVNRVINNINIIVNNLILKYVEDDIVLSLNVKSAESFSVNGDWESAFIELAQPELVLRRVCQFSDLTVCLDKRNASGKIEMYQEPLLYKCSLMMRMHMTFDSINAKRASVIKINTLCEKLDISMSDTQLPMFIRLVQLLMALYYGELGPPHTENEEEGDSLLEATTNEETSMNSQENDGADEDENSNPEGWASWAWSYVPQLVIIEDEEELETYQQGRPRPKKKLELPILALGFYFNHVRVTFKLTDVRQDSPFYGPQKIVFNPFMGLAIEGACTEILLKGEPFFNAQAGCTNARVVGMGDCACELPDLQEGHHYQPFLYCGDFNIEKKQENYITGSLFDGESPENNAERTMFIFDLEQHQMKYSESWALQRFGAFWLDYIFTMDVKDDEGSRSSSRHSSEAQFHTVKEMSSNKVLFGPSTWNINSSAVHRLQKFVFCANDHEYEPYSRPKPEIVDENRPVPSIDEVAALEEYIPIRSLHVTFLNVNVSLSMAEHPQCEIKKKKIVLKQRKSHRKESSRRKRELSLSYQPIYPLPACQLLADRIDIQNTLPMYGRSLVKSVSKLSQPSGNLLHHCYAHMYIKVFGCQVGLTTIGQSCDNPLVLNILPSCSAAVYKKTIKFPMYWSNPALVKSELLIEVPHFGVNSTKAQVILLHNIIESWQAPIPNLEQLSHDTLMDDVFRPTAKSFPTGQPILDATISNVEMKYSSNTLVRAVSGTVGSISVAIQSLEDGRDSTTPLFYGPIDNTGVHTVDFYRSPLSVPAADSNLPDYDNDIFTFTVQIPKDKDAGDACGLCLLNIHGTSVCVDPILYSWLTYQPSEKIIPLLTKQDSIITLTTMSTHGSKSQEQMHNTSSQDSTHSSSLRLSKQSESQSPSQPTPSPTETTQDALKTKKNKDGMPNIVEIWTIIKQLQVQVEMNSCSIYLPSSHLQLNTMLYKHNIPQAFHAAVLSSESLYPPSAVICLPSVKVISAGHKHISPLQEIPLDQLDVPIETGGDKLPWSISFTNFSCYTILDFQRVYYMVKPMGVTSTLAVSTVDGTPSGIKSTLGLCLHADMQAVMLNCSHEQVNLIYTLVMTAVSTAKNVLTKKTSISSPPSSMQPSPGVIVTSGKQPIKTVQSTASSSAVEIDAPIEPASADETGTSTGLSWEEDGCKTSGRKSARISLWMQWTVPKLSVNLYGEDSKIENREIKIISELEDLSASIDIQDVYSKVKCKIGTLNVNHYNKSNDVWKPGVFNGVLFSCTEKINRNTGVMKQQTEMDSPSPFKSPFSTAPLKSQDNAGFLSVTFTSALSKSVRQKMFGLKGEKGASKFTNYINEICLNIQPYDIVLWCPTIVTALGIFVVNKDGSHSVKGQKVTMGQRLRSTDHMSEITVSTNESGSRKRLRTRKRKESSDLFPFSTRNLPLLYVNMSEFRLFVPSGSKKSEDSSKKCDLDTVLMQISSVSLVPHADNPLSRLVLKKDIYRHAMHAGILQQPGSEVEDRQYQLDISGMSLCVVSWEELVGSEQGNSMMSPGTEELTMGQNPALEWNTALARKSPQGIRLNPVVLGFDVRIVAAPAVMCDKQTPEGGMPETVTVCGHSLEINMTTDMEVYLSTEQVHLAECIVNTNIMTILKSAEKQTIGQGEIESNKVSNAYEDGKASQIDDSGIGSESSTVIRIPSSSTRKGKRQMAPQMATLHERSGRSVSFTPFDVLLTAGKLSVLLYSMEEVSQSGENQENSSGKMKFQQKSSLNGKSTRGCELKAPVEDNKKLPRKLSGHVEKTRRGSAHMDSPSSGRVVKPFLYTVFSQPHTIFSIEQRQQRVELSCYDFTVRGVAANYQNTDTGKILPDPSDYGVQWLETCQGEPDPKTGILPSLYTLTVNDFMFKPANVKLNIARPLKLNLSITKVDEVMEFLGKLSPKTTDNTMMLKKDLASPDVSQQETEKHETAPPEYVPGNAGDVKNVKTGAGRRDNVFPIIIPMPSADQNSTTSLSVGSYRKKNLSRAQDDSVTMVEMILAQLDTVLFQACEFVVVVATVPHPNFPHAVFSLGNMSGEMSVKSKSNGLIEKVNAMINLNEIALKTSLQHKSRPLIGPVNTTMLLDADWCMHSGSDEKLNLPKIAFNVECGLIQLQIGLAQFNCIEMMMKHVTEYLEKSRKITGVKESKTNKEKVVDDDSDSLAEKNSINNDIVSSTDDLRVGTFQYITDKDGMNIQPKPNEIVFCSYSPDSLGTMTWCYKEPRVLTYVAVTPVPFTTSVGSDLSNSSHVDKQIPCTMEYWDNLKKSFVVYKQLFVSEDQPYHVKLPDIKDATTANENIAAEMWRVVLHSGNYQEDDLIDDDTSSVHAFTDEPPISPMALAASMRVDSCFAAKFVPAFSASLNFAIIQIKCSNHIKYAGTASPVKLDPYEFDGTAPVDQEFMVVTLEGPSALVNCWRGDNTRTHIQISSSLQCDLLEYRNLTMQSVIETFDMIGSLYIKPNAIGLQLSVEPVFVKIAQSAVHTLNLAVQTLLQNNKPEKEQLLYNYYVICNDTQETLRFGQVSTDESIILESRKMHAYSWRTHKSAQQLHVCIEGWGNWRWVEPFNIDDTATTIRTIQHKGKAATLFVKVKQLSPLQKQVIISGRQWFSSRLTKDLEVQLIRVSNVGSRTMQSKHTLHLPAKTYIPSCIIEDEAVTGVRVRLSDVSCDWSEQFAISGEMSKTCTLIKIPCTGKKHIYIWCRLFTDNQQRLVLFSPLFVVRSHLPRPVVMNIETSKTKSIRHYNISDQGQNISLYDLEPDIWHYVTFQLSAKSALSHPPVSISTQQINEIHREPPSDIDIESLCYNWEQNLSEYWPYNTLDYDESFITFDRDIIHEIKSPFGVEGESSMQLSNIDLKVNLSQCWCMLNTLLIDVKPWCLMVNETQLELKVLEEDEIPLVVKPGNVVTPQNFQSTVEFFIGNNRSQPVLLLKEALSPRGRYDLLTKADGVLPLEGSTHVSIACDGKPSRLCYLTLLSTVKHGVRVITIKDRYIFVNKSKEDLSLRTVAIVDSDTKFDKSSLVPKIQMVPASQSDSSASVQAIEFWDVPRYDQSPPSMNHMQYLSFTFANIGTSKKSWRNWTQFVPIDTKLPRHSVAMPIRNVDQSNGSIDRKDPLAYVVTVMEANGVVYIMVDVNPMPRIIIHNNCSFPLHYGQGLIQDCTEEMVTVVEEQDMLSPLPLVEAHRSTCYEFPHVQSQFPQFNNQNQIQPKLHICIARDLDTVYLKQEEKVEQWSDEINIGEFGGQRSEIMILSHGGYVFVNSRTVGACTHVFIEELSMEGQTGQRSKLGVPSLLRQETEAESPMDITIEGSVMASRVCFVLMDELHNRVSSTEVLRFMMDDVHLAYFPLVKPDHPTTMQQGVQFAVRTAQIDNQLFQQGAFDFPVLLMAQHKIPSRDESEFAVLPISAASEHSYQTSIFAVRLIFEMDQFRSVSCLQDVTVSVKPLTLFMEDQFIYQMVRVISSYKIPHELKQPIKSKFPKSGDQLEPMRWKDVPAEAKSLSLALINPLAVNHLRIKPLTVLASAHASLKVYLASDHTSLSFGQFQCGPVFTTTRQLVQCLTMHYASGALFKAGSVLGSLEILGNPAGLLRNIGSGVADFFRLPYEGIIRGPSAFVTGVTSGTSSLVKHVSTGTITSITNFASSVARNMDRLSLDPDHLMRQEEHRKQIPERISEGLKQGLSGFGISLLGAVAGVVDQPIQSWTKSSLPTTRTQKATGVLSGVGKGLVGAVVKPIGGAAEFVSQTGQGILHGAGLVGIPKARFMPCSEQAAMATNGYVKYVWKMLQTLPSAAILMHLDITIVTYHGLHHSGCLLLTPDVLFIVSTSEDTQQQAYPLTEITCYKQSTDSGILCIALKQAITPCTAEKEETSNRVADFVDATSGHAGRDVIPQPSQSSDTTSEQSPPSGTDQVTIKSYKYLVDPRFRDTFISLFNQAKRKLEGKGFNVDETGKTTFSKFHLWHIKTKKKLDDIDSM